MSISLDTPGYLAYFSQMRLIFLTVVLSVFQGLAADARTWTSTSGKALEGDLVGVQSGKAYIRVGKRVGAVPIKGLSRSDQAFIKKWLIDQQLARLSSRLEGLVPSEGREQTAEANTPEDAAALRPENIMARMLAERKAREDDKAKTLAAKKAVFAQAKSKRAAKRCVT
jgi:hypothetical protein